MSFLREHGRDAAAGALCVFAAAWALHVALSGMEFRRRRAQLEENLARVEALERGDPASAAWRARVERSGARAPDAAAAVSAWTGRGTISLEAQSDEPLGGGWTRREISLRAHGADFADLSSMLDALGAGEPGWRLRSGEWTPGNEAGRGEALLVLETLEPGAEDAGGGTAGGAP